MSLYANQAWVLCKPVEVRQEHHQTNESDGQKRCFQRFVDVDGCENLLHAKTFFRVKPS